MNISKLIGRESSIFDNDTLHSNDELKAEIMSSSFLVLGGGGSIGQAVTKEIFKRKPKKLHIVDINENGLVELVRDIRSSFGYIDGDFQTFVLDIGSIEYDAFFTENGKYNYILNLSALKHVRSEKDPFTLMRMIDVNILHTDKTLLQASKSGAKKYFCVSTDKAANPINMMGASKRIMETFLMRRSLDIKISTARFANVAFSNGSLLDGFKQRFDKHQPLVAPYDVFRYFITPQEAGELCLLSCVFGNNRDIFFPKLSQDIHLISFKEIALKFITENGYEPHVCSSEDEARELTKSLPKLGKWPCLFTKSDTTGEKDYEEFFTDIETIDWELFENIAIIKNEAVFNIEKIKAFENNLQQMKDKGTWSKEDLIENFKQLLPEFRHKETGKYLDSKM